MSGKIVSVVEGKKSEKQTVPLLLRRILHEKLQIFDDIVESKSVYLPRTKVTNEDELRRTIELIRRTRLDAAGVLFLFDSDDDLPCQLGPAIHAKAQAMTHLPIAVVLAKREFECWFLGAKESLRGIRGIKQDACNVEEPENVRDGKGRLSQNMEGKWRYVGVVDQPALAAKMDIEMARQNCPSFDKFIREVERLVAQVNLN